MNIPPTERSLQRPLSREEDPLATNSTAASSGARGWRGSSATSLMIASRVVDTRRHRREFREAALLALVPVGVAVVFGLLLAPRRPAPDGVPLPLADGRVIAQVASSDHTLAEF